MPHLIPSLPALLHTAPHASTSPGYCTRCLFLYVLTLRAVNVPFCTQQLPVTAAYDGGDSSRTQVVVENSATGNWSCRETLSQPDHVKESCRCLGEAQPEQAQQASVLRPCKLSTQLTSSDDAMLQGCVVVEVLGTLLAEAAGPAAFWR